MHAYSEACLSQLWWGMSCTPMLRHAKIKWHQCLHFYSFLNTFQVIGASLGAQVAGYVGFYLDGRLARITGLDPSGPLFHSVPRNERLDSTDARFVDVIHTAGKWVGNDEIIGHADFFPNNGRAPQPGCEGKESLDLTCSHFKVSTNKKENSSYIKSNQVYFTVRCITIKKYCSVNLSRIVVVNTMIQLARVRKDPPQAILNAFLSILSQSRQIFPF